MVHGWLSTGIYFFKKKFFFYIYAIRKQVQDHSSFTARTINPIKKLVKITNL
jgi:hypothetical protein